MQGFVGFFRYARPKCADFFDQFRVTLYACHARSGTEPERRQTRSESMIRYLKVLLGAALALTAFGVLSASAHAAEERFHCSAEPCTWTLQPDGAVPSKTAHHVFEVTDGKNVVSFTCNQLTGHATSTKTTNTLTFTGLIYHGCSVAGGGAVTVRMNKCDYHVTGTPEKKAHLTILCESASKIEVEINETKCIITIGQSEKDLTGLTLHKNIGEAAKKTTEATLEANVENIPVAGADGTLAQCGVDPAKVLTGHYTTGNTLITGETDPKDGSKPVMENAWYE